MFAAGSLCHPIIEFTALTEVTIPPNWILGKSGKEKKEGHEIEGRDNEEEREWPTLLDKFLTMMTSLVNLTKNR